MLVVATTMSITTPFTGSGGLETGLSLILRKLPMPLLLPVPMNAAVVNIKENATITSLTPEASDYTDIVYVVGTGTF